MQNSCKDDFYTTFSSYRHMQEYHEQMEKNSQWKRSKISDLSVVALSADSPLLKTPGAFAMGTSKEAVEDTAQNLGLAIRIDGSLYPVRMTAYKSLLDRAKIGGTVLPKLTREELATVLNMCLQHYDADTLVLIRDEKVSAVHSGDEADYSVLPIHELLETLRNKLDERFPRNEYQNGYCDHAISSAAWIFPEQKEELLGAYAKVLAESGKKTMASKLIPGIRFITSDTGVASAKVSALLMGGQYPIHIGGCISVDHRYKSEVTKFNDALEQLFAQFGDSVARLQKLLEIPLDYPVNAMTRLCKKLSMPKKAALEAIGMFEMSFGGGMATAHDVFMAMQEILFILKSEHTPQSKLLTIEENLARALTVRWSDYDLAKAVEY